MRERFWCVYKLESVQIFRQLIYWLVLAVVGLLMATSFYVYEFVTAQEFLSVGASRNIIGLGSLFILFLGAFSATRSRRNRIDVLEATLPTGAEVHVARWAALVTASLPYIVLAAGMAFINGPLESFMAGLPNFLFESMLTFMVTALVVWLIEVIFGIRRWMYPVLAFLWIGSIFTMSSSNNWWLAPWIGQFGFTGFGPKLYNETWGRLTQGNFYSFFNLFYVGVVVLFLGLIIRTVERRRFGHTSGIIRGVIAGGGVIALTGYMLYGLNFIHLRSQNIQALSPLDGYALPNYGTPNFEPLAYQVTRYDVALDVENTPVFVVKMDVVNEGDAPLSTLEFMLIPGMEIDSANAPFTRDGSIVTFSPEIPLAPGQTLTIDMQYSGDLQRYTIAWGLPPELENFIRRDGINLSPGAYWYPQPRRQHQGELIGDLRTQSSELKFLAFSLRVTGTKMPLASNLPATGENTYYSASTTSAMLIGAPNLETYSPADGVYFVLPRNLRILIDEFLEQGLQKNRAVVKQYFPSDMMIILAGLRWYVAPVSTISQPYPQADIGVLMANTPWVGSYNQWFYEYGIYAPVQHFFGDVARTVLTENVAQFVNLQITYDGDSADMRAELELHKQRMGNNLYHEGITQAQIEQLELQFSFPGHAQNYGITQRLIDVYEAYGTDGVVLLLNAMRDEAKMLRISVVREVVAWMDAWIAENLADA